MARRPFHALTAVKVKSAGPGFYSDGGGLYLRVDPSGARRWVQRVTISGKQRNLGLGGWPDVSLSDAREKATDNRRLAKAGGDPLAAKRRRVMPTFAESAQQVIELRKPTWRNADHAYQWANSLRLHAFPVIGDMSVGEVTSADVMTVLTPIWNAKTETARRVRQRIGVVMTWAIAQGFRTDNPAGEIVGAALPRIANNAVHHRALPYDQVAGAIQLARASTANLSTRLAFEFLVLTAARSIEVRSATWADIDRDAGVWTIPAHRMKNEREHRVPLSRRALEALGEATALGDADGDAFVFPGTKPGRPLSDMAFVMCLRRVGIDAVPHGFRSSFRDWAAEQTDAPHAVMELALAHSVGNRVEAAYARSDLFDRRRVLMDAWAEYLGDSPGPITPS